MADHATDGCEDLTEADTPAHRAATDGVVTARAADEEDLRAEAARLERGRLLFARPGRFVISAARLDQIPDDSLPEVAFAGRSNVGKSSLINAVTGQNTLARVSNTPGRTQQLNFFDQDGRLMLTDLPGYGYAKAPKALVDAWTRLVERYLRGRQPLRRALILVDARHGPKETDQRVLALLDGAAVAYQVILTKADKVSANQLASRIADMGRDLARHPAAHPVVIATSAQTGYGIAEIRAELAALALHDQTASRSPGPLMPERPGSEQQR